jgi:Na+/proline symporter
VEEKYEEVSQQKRAEVRNLITAFRSGEEDRIEQANQQLQNIKSQADAIRDQGIQIMKKNDPGMDTRDTNYIFLSFVVKYLPVGVIGLVLAVIFAASMSSTASELNALASTTVVDIYKRLIKKDKDDRHYLKVSRIATFFWGIYAILLAQTASRLGSLIEAVNIVGSLFYGTILGIFLVGFYMKFIRGTATFYAAIIAELIVLFCFLFTGITFLWYNVIGCLVVILIALVLNQFPRLKIKNI